MRELGPTPDPCSSETEKHMGEEEGAAPRALEAGGARRVALGGACTGVKGLGESHKPGGRREWAPARVGTHKLTKDLYAT